ncbi:MAG: DinB family protein [Longimicrobiaceae bacterium]
MDATWKAMIWRQFGAAIEMLENALLACPDELWSDRSRRPEFWYVAFHTLFYLDVYSSGSVEAYTPPAPFTLGELEDDVMPPRAYGKDELLAFLVHGRRKCRAAIDAMTDEKVSRRCGFEWLDLSEAELLLYNLRHVQHHVGQLNLILRQATNSGSRWVRTATGGELRGGRGGAPPAPAGRGSGSGPAARR